jgi:hypothetical protein
VREIGARHRVVLPPAARGEGPAEPGDSGSDR